VHRQEAPAAKRGERFSAPVLDFPAGFLRAASAFMNAGTTVNGESSPTLPMVPQNESERY
jgi:hypothetical protein